MILNIFPSQLNNDYQGSMIAKYCFIVITLITIARSIIHLLYFDGGAQSIASIPLNLHNLEAARTIVLIFHLWGISQLIIGVAYVIVIWKYQNIIPLCYLLLFFEYLLREIIFHYNPIIINNTPPGTYANFVMIPLSLIMLYYSLKPK